MAHHRTFPAPSQYLGTTITTSPRVSSDPKFQHQFREEEEEEKISPQLLLLRLNAICISYIILAYMSPSFEPTPPILYYLLRYFSNAVSLYP